MDVLLHQLLCAGIVCLGVERLLHLYWKTDPWLDIVGWYLTALGAFAQFIWVDDAPGYPDVFMMLGASMLLLLHAHPKLRGFAAERRQRDRNRKTLA